MKIGDTYQGGIIAYILQEGDQGYVANEIHGIIAAPSDQSNGIQWYNGSYTSTGVTGTALGTGQANTSAIASSQGAGSYAAQLCTDLVIGEYDDGYLPSKDEFNKLYVNREPIGSFSRDAPDYWSSTEYDFNYAWLQSFTNGFQYSGDLKYLKYEVRAVRAFYPFNYLSIKILPRSG